MADHDLTAELSTYAQYHHGNQTSCMPVRLTFFVDLTETLNPSESQE